MNSMSRIAALLVLVAAVCITGCEEEASTVVDSGDQNAVEQYNAMVADEQAGYEEAEQAAQEGGAQ